MAQNTPGAHTGASRRIRIQPRPASAGSYHTPSGHTPRQKRWNRSRLPVCALRLLAHNGGNREPGDGSRLADQAVAHTPLRHPLRPAVLLAAAEVYRAAGDHRATAQALAEFFSLRDLWRPSDHRRELAATEMMALALWRLRRRTEVILWADTAAVLATMEGDYERAFRNLRTALHACLLLDDRGAGVYLQRMTDLIMQMEAVEPEAGTLLAADRSWYCLAQGRHAEAMQLVQQLWQNPGAPAQPRSQALWVAAEVSLQVGRRPEAAHLRVQAAKLATEAQWELGLQLCSSLARRLAGPDPADS